MAKQQSIADSIRSAVNENLKEKLDDLGDPPFVTFNSQIAIKRKHSGSLALDELLGGGVPEGRIIQLFGPESGGKCVTVDAYVSTPDGLLTVGEIFAEVKEKPDLGKIKQPTINYSLLNRYGQTESTVAFTKNGLRTVAKLTTKSGHSIRTTANHPHLTINSRGSLVWKKTGQFQPGDYLVIARKQRISGGQERNLTEMYALGVLIADGHFAKGGLQVTNNDSQIKDLIEGQFQDLFGFPKIAKYSRAATERNGSYDYHLTSKEAVEAFYKKYNLQPGLAKDKVFPLYVRQSDEASIKACIQGYLDCESYIADNHLEVASASHELLHQLKLLLLRFGIISMIQETSVKEYPDNRYWTLSIRGEAFRQYVSKIGTRLAYREAQIEKALRFSSQVQTNVDSIPFMSGILEDLYNSFETTGVINALFDGRMGETAKTKLTYPYLEKILEVVPKEHHLTRYLQQLYDLQYFFDPIELIEWTGQEPTFDFAMESSHSFIANGLVTHNTSVSLSIAGQFLKDGHYPIGFIDAENAIDPAMAKNTFGVDLFDEDKVLFSQMDDAEAIYEMIGIMADKGVPLIIVDSTDAMLTEAEEEGGFADAHVGQMARRHSLGLKKVKRRLRRSGTVLLLISQVRQKIEMSGGPKARGPNETTSGGNAIRFYASIRGRVSRIEYIPASGAEPRGMKMVIKTHKNKTSRPFRTVELTYMYDRGIVNDVDSVRIAAQYGVIQKRASIYEYTGVKYKGAAEMNAFFQANPKVWEKVRDATMLAMQQGSATALAQGEADKEIEETEDGKEVVVASPSEEAEEMPAPKRSPRQPRQPIKVEEATEQAAETTTTATTSTSNPVEPVADEPATEQPKEMSAYMRRKLKKEAEAKAAAGKKGKSKK